MYMKQTDLARQFSIGSTLTNHICRLIDANPDRYGTYAKIGRRYGLYAFADAYKYRKALEAGEAIPEFDPQEIQRQFPGAECHEYYEAGARAMRNTLFGQIDDYFNDTIFPNDIEGRKLARLIKMAVESIIVTSEVKQ